MVRREQITADTSDSPNIKSQNKYLKTYYDEVRCYNNMRLERVTMMHVSK